MVDKAYDKMSQNFLDAHLIRALKDRNHSEVKRLINNGADIHTDKDWPLSYAATIGDMHMVKYLLKNGAKIRHGYYGALSSAHRNDRTEVADYLERIVDISGLNFSINKRYVVGGK